MKHQFQFQLKSQFAIVVLAYECFPSVLSVAFCLVCVCERERVCVQVLLTLLLYNYKEHRLEQFICLFSSLEPEAIARVKYASQSW